MLLEKSIPSINGKVHNWQEIDMSKEWKEFEWVRSQVEGVIWNKSNKSPGNKEKGFYGRFKWKRRLEVILQGLDFKLIYGDGKVVAQKTIAQNILISFLNTQQNSGHFWNRLKATW